MPPARQNSDPACRDRNLIAIYDLDRTITRSPTFTPFLLFAARRDAPWRLALLPVWIVALIGYRIGLYGRETLKPFGIRLFVGNLIGRQRADRLAREFADRLNRESGYLPGALRQIEADRASGATLVIATAAPEFYAREIARRLGFDACLASLHERGADGSYKAKLAGRNNYGAEKWRRVQAWLVEEAIDRGAVKIVAYSDHLSDAPLLNAADRACFITSEGTCAIARCEVHDWRS